MPILWQLRATVALVVVVMQATTAATIRKGLQRFIGTLIGIVLGSILVFKIHNPYLLDFLLIFFLFITYYLKACNLINYGIFVVPLTIMVVFLVSALVPAESLTLILARIYDTSLGALIGITASLLILPNHLKPEVDAGKHHILKTHYCYLHAIINCLLKYEDSQSAAVNLQHLFEHSLEKNRQLFQDGIYELMFKSNDIKAHEEFLQLTEKLGQYLFSMHYLSKQDVSKAIVNSLNHLLHSLAKSAQQASEIYDCNHRLKNIITKDLLDQLDDIHKHLSPSEKLFMVSLKAELTGYYQCLERLTALKAVITLL